MPSLNQCYATLPLGVRENGATIAPGEGNGLRRHTVELSRGEGVTLNSSNSKIYVAVTNERDGPCKESLFVWERKEGRKEGTAIGTSMTITGLQVLSITGLDFKAFTWLRDFLPICCAFVQPYTYFLVRWNIYCSQQSQH